MSYVEQWEHDEQRAMETEITTLREQVEKLTKERELARHDCWNLTEKVIPNIKESHQDQLAALAEQNEKLREQVAHLSLYKPARRTEQKAEPVKSIGLVNEPFWFGGIIETDEEFVERAGRKVESGQE